MPALSSVMSNITYLLLAIPGFILFAWTARRLLAVVKLSVTKMTIAALGGLAVGDILSRVLISRGLQRDEAILVGLVIGLISTMLLIIAFEAFSRPARTPVRRGTRNPAAYVRQKTADVRRSTEIAQIARRYGLSRGMGLAVGRSMSAEEATDYGIRSRGALDEAGGVFVKLGQLLATRPDIIPPETADELAKLHQDVEPAPDRKWHRS